MSYDKASPNAKIGCSKSNDPEFLEQLVRDGKTNREIALILDVDYSSVARILYRYGIKRDPNRPCKRCGGPIDVLEHLYKYSTYRAQKNLLGDKYVASSTYSRCVKAEAYAKGGNPVYKYFLKG